MTRRERIADATQKAYRVSRKAALETADQVIAGDPEPGIIRVMPSPWWFGGFVRAAQREPSLEKGSVIILQPHELKYPPEARQGVRAELLESPRGGRPCPCRLLDPWPNAPAFWPPELCPGASTNPGHPPFGPADSGS